MPVSATIHAKVVVPTLNLGGSVGRRADVIFVAGVSEYFYHLTKRAGVDMRFHDFRHEGIYRLFERGLQIHQVALISGHKQWTTLQRYTHVKPETVESLQLLRSMTQPEQLIMAVIISTYFISFIFKQLSLFLLEFFWLVCLEFFHPK